MVKLQPKKLLYKKKLKENNFRLERILRFIILLSLPPFLGAQPAAFSTYYNILTGNMSCEQFSLVGFSIDWCTWSWSWTLASSSSIIFHISLCLFYAFTVKLLQLWVDFKKSYRVPSWVEPVRKVHNISLSLVSFIMFVVMTFSIVIDGRLQSWSTMSCQMTPMTGIIAVIFLYLPAQIPLSYHFVICFQIVHYLLVYIIIIIQDFMAA